MSASFALTEPPAPQSPPTERRSDEEVLVALMAGQATFSEIDRVPYRRVAARLLVGSVRALETGPVEVGDQRLPESTIGLLVTSGSLLKAVVHAGRALTELVTAGDVLLPWPPAVDGLAADMHLTALEPVRMVVLDARCLQVAARRPQFMVELQRRLAQQEHRVAVHGAICQFSNVDDRIIAVLRHFASRIGRVGVNGTTVPIPLTHAALGELVGARRPTVSLALARLCRAGLVRHLGDGTMLLAPAVPCDPAEPFAAA